MAVYVQCTYYIHVLFIAITKLQVQVHVVPPYYKF